MDAVLQPHNGAMTLFVNGQPQPFVSFKPTELPDQELFTETVDRTVPDMAKRGVHVHFVPVYFRWDAEGEYDFSATDERVQRVLAADPEGWIFIRIQAENMRPSWWMESHPDEVLRFGTDVTDRDSKPAPHQTGPWPSLASSFWDGPATDAMKAMARHVRSQPYADRVIGYLPTAYNTNEWFLRSYDETQVCDLSPCMNNAFRRYVASQTGHTNGYVVPGRFDRSRGDEGFLMHPDPAKARTPVVAFYRFLNELCAQNIVKITKALREGHAPDRIVVGTFYGYSLGLANFHWLADSGHLNLSRLLADDGPDFTCSPLEYFTRNLREKPAGGFCWAQSTAPDSGRIAGKGYFGEDDFCPPNQGPVGWSSAGDMTEDAELLKRNFAFTLCKGQLQWWYDLHGHWYESETRLDAVASCTRIASEAIQRDRSPVSEVAVVIDERAPWYTSLDPYLQRALFWENFYHSFSEIGAPVDLMMISDLPRADTSKYKAVFFPTCFALTAEERKAIEALKRDGRSLVFYLADGYISPDNGETFSSEHASELIGMQVEAKPNLHPLRVTTAQDHPLVSGFASQSYGVHTEKTPSFHITDTEAEPLGYFAGRGPVGLAMRRHPGWTSLYTGAPCLPAQLVRNIIADAGAHVYTEAELPLYVNASYLGLFNPRAGRLTVRLPEPRRVRECFSGLTMADGATSEFSWDAKDCTTYLFEMD
jgi:hypothetical protein